MKLLLIILLFFVLINCKDQNYNKIQFISVSGRAINYNETDSLIMAIYVHFYAEIGQDGNCSVIKRGNELVNLNIDNDIISRIMTKSKSFKNDSFLSHTCQDCIYDGPTHQLIFHKDKKQPVTITYTNMKGTDNDFLDLYNYIDSISQTAKGNTDSIKTLNLIINRDSMINKIKTNILKTEEPFGRDTIMIIL